MSGTIVVGVDTHEQPRADAVALGTALAAALGAELLLAHIFPYEPLALGGVGPFPLAQESAEILALAERLAPPGTRSEARPSTSPARGLHALAQDVGADLLVVGSSHRGPLGRVILGSHAEGVLSGAPCAVAVAPRGLATRGWELDEIAAAYDGSADASRGLARARRLADAVGARLLLFAVAPLAPLEWSAYAYQPDWHSLQELRREDLERRLAEAADGAATEVVLGDVVEELRRLTERVDLLVLGSRAYGPIKRVVMGATGHRVVREAACPVLVVPRSAADRDEGEAAEADGEGAAAT